MVECVLGTIEPEMGLRGGNDGIGCDKTFGTITFDWKFTEFFLLTKKKFLVKNNFNIKAIFPSTKKNVNTYRMKIFVEIVVRWNRQQMMSMMTLCMWMMGRMQNWREWQWLWMMNVWNNRVKSRRMTTTHR